MGYHNIFARQQLVEIRNELLEEFEGIKSTNEDDSLDQELKFGARGALEFAIGVVDTKIQRLENEQK